MASSAKSSFYSILNYCNGSCRNAVFMGAGDVLIQHYNSTKENNQINWNRTLKFATIGLCFMGPMLVYWKNNISTIVKCSRNNSTQILKQIFWDQIYLAPCINLGIISMSGLLDGASTHDIEHRISMKFPYILKCHYALWPGVQLFCNFCIQPTMRSGLANCFAILWYAFISGVLHQNDK